jgi:hypothetical protein
MIALVAFLALPAPQDVNPLREFIDRYEEDRRALERAYPVPMSTTRAARLKKFNAEKDKELDGFDFAALPPEGRIDWVLLRSHLRHETREIEQLGTRDEEIQSLVPFRDAIVGLEEARRRFEPVDPAKAGETLVETARRAKEARKGLESASKPGRTLARRAARRVNALRETLKAWHGFYAGYDPAFTWWAAKPYEEAARELKDYGDKLEDLAGTKKEGPEGLVGDPIGREALLAELEHEMIPYSPEELIALAEREFAWCDVRMKEAARDMGFDGDWAKALERVKSLHVEPGRQPQLIRDLAREAEAFLEKHDLVTVPDLCREVWRMEMMTPDRQKVSPYFTGGEIISVSFPTHDMTHEQKLMSLRGNNIHFSRATVQHELIPGHHLQSFMAARHAAHRRPFRTAFLVEGWALYWEMLLWDLGFAKSAEDRTGMLFWRSHRCARIIVSLNFHLGKTAPREMVDFLTKRVGHEPAGAEAEVRRYIAGDYGPLYQAAYMLGGLQLRALHGELVKSGKLTNRAFHDAVLRENSIPIEMIRASLTGQTLTPDFRTQWRFLDGK